MLKKIKFYNSETEQWEIVAVSEKGDKGDPFEYEDFTPEQLEGLKGPVFTPSVDEEGNLSWTNNGNLENPETINIKGDKGETGEPFEYEDFTEEQLEGLRGPQGYIFSPSVDDEGNLSWSNNGDLENPETINIKGERGKDGVFSNSISAIEIVGELPAEGEWVNGTLYIVVEGEGGE